MGIGLTFDWNTVIANIAALSISNVTVTNHAPRFTQDCRVPALYPSFSPDVGLNSVEPLSCGIHGTAFKRANYSINLVYLHIETSQNVDNSKYEVEASAAMSRIYVAIADHDTDLGTYRVTPAGFSVSEKLIEVGGREYVGGLITLEAIEYNQM